MSLRSRMSSSCRIETLENRQFLSASPVSAPLATDPGSDAATSLDLGNFNKIKSTQVDTIGTGDTADFFKFTVTQNTTFSAKVKGAGKVGKLVKPALALTNSVGAAAPAGKTMTAAKQNLGPGTYYVAVNGLETGTTDYKLTLTTKQYKGKKPVTFTSPADNGNPDGDPNGDPNGDPGGQTGQTVTGNLTTTADVTGNFSDTYRFTATQSGTFELPATFASDVFWNAAPFDNATTPGVGGAGTGTGDGTLSVLIEAGNDYIFNVVASNTVTPYSITFDPSFTNVNLVPGG